MEEKNSKVHIYVDDITGNKYYYNGEKLVLLSKPKPEIGDTGDDEFDKREREQRKQQAEKEREEDGTPEETEEERKERIKRLKDRLSNSEEIKELEAEAEEKVNRERKLERDKATAAKNARSSIQQFQDSLRLFIANQVKKIKSKTWTKSNMSYEGSGVIKPARAKTSSGKIPKINVYFDQSGSWSQSDVNTGMEAIGILNNYVKRGEITYKVYYFANTIHTEASEARDEGGTGAGYELIKHIQETAPDNVIVMTDDDFDRWGEIVEAPNIYVPGAVWYLFRNGRSKRLMQHLKGRQQSKAFDI